MTDAGETCATCGAAVPPGAWYCLACGSAHAAPRPPAPSGARRAAVLAALLAVAVGGAVVGAWIQREHSDPGAAPVTVPTIVTETVTDPAPTPAPAAPAPTPLPVTAVAQAPTATALAVARGGRARASRR